MTTLSILQQIAATTKRTEKEAILRQHQHNEELKLTMQMTYHPNIIFWIHQVPDMICSDIPSSTISLTDAIQQLIKLVISRSLTGHNAIQCYRSLLEQCSLEDREVLMMIVHRDLRCGINTATINKIWPNLIPTYAVMLADTDAKDLVYPVYVQCKMDGLRAIITHSLIQQDIIIRTRNGSHITSLSMMNDELKKVILPGESWDGELVYMKDQQTIASRKEGNGILNRAIRGTISPEQAEHIKFIAWDIIDESQSIPYQERFERLQSRLIQPNSKVQCIEHKIANNRKELDNYFFQMLEQGEEGIVAKNMHAMWQPKLTRDMVKFKAVLTADLIVVDWEEGTGRHQGKMGALVCESSDGLIRVNVGTGFSDEQRHLMTKEHMIGKIIEVKYNAKITKKVGGCDSLYLPRFVTVREDKDIANSAEEIQ